MEKCEKCGRRYTRSKYVLRDRDTSFLESFLIAGFILMIPFFIPNTTLAGFAFFIFLAGMYFAISMVLVGKAVTKEELHASLTEELKEKKTKSL